MNINTLNRNTICYSKLNNWEFEQWYNSDWLHIETTSLFEIMSYTETCGEKKKKEGETVPCFWNFWSFQWPCSNLLRMGAKAIDRESARKRDKSFIQQLLSYARKVQKIYFIFMRMPHTQNHKLYFLHNNGEKKKKAKDFWMPNKTLKKKKSNMFPSLKLLYFK